MFPPDSPVPSQEVLKKVRKLRTKHTQLSPSPDKERVAMWTENARRLVVYNVAKGEVTETLRPKHRIVHVSWCFCTGNLVITSRKRVSLYNMQKKKLRTLIFVENASECYRTNSRLFSVLGGQAVITDTANVAKIRLHCSFLKVVGVFFVVVFENSVTVFDSKLAIIYDHLFGDETKIRDVDIRNRKIYVLTESSIFGYDLNLHTPRDFLGFRIFDKFLFLIEKEQLVVCNRSMSSEMLKVPIKRCWIDKNSGRVYVLGQNVVVAYALRAKRRLKFELIGECETYCEQEDEFDTSDSQYTDF